MKRSNGLDLVGYSDSDHVGDIKDRKSTTGMVYLLGENLIFWASQKQQIVALSSFEGIWLPKNLAG